MSVMDTSKETVLREIMNMCYDILVEYAGKSDDPQQYYMDFFRALAETEEDLYSSDYGIETPRVSHPLTAMRKYRIMNVKSWEYRFVDETKPVDISNGTIMLKQWKCRYIGSCLKHKDPLCIRGYAMGLAIDRMSDGRFLDLDVDFDVDGCCDIKLHIDYEGDLANAPEEERVEDDDIYRVLSQEDHLNLSINLWVRGIEHGAVAIYGKDGADEFLRSFHKKLVDKWIEKFFKIDSYIGLPISLWTEGKLIFD